MKRCLILGGDGFLGSHLTESLLKKGYPVSIFGKFKNGKVKNLSHIRNNVTVISGDFLNISDLEKALENIDYVFHFISSGNPATSMHKPKEEIKLNILPTLNLLNICAKKRIKKVIFPSSGGSIYGNISKPHISEEDPLNPISPHALGKLYIEKLLHYYYLQFRLDHLIYRISNVYGEKQNTNNKQGVISIVIDKALRGEDIKLYGNTVRDYIYVGDVADFIAENFDKKHKDRIYNIGSGKGVTLYSLIEMIKKQTGLRMSIKKLPRRNCDVTRTILNITKIRQEFGFSPKVTLNKGIIRTYKYLYGIL